MSVSPNIPFKSLIVVYRTRSTSGVESFFYGRGPVKFIPRIKKCLNWKSLDTCLARKIYESIYKLQRDDFC